MIVFTDLDASLLNESDYRWEDATPTLKRMDTEGIPLVLASSKTAAEMRQLHKELTSVITQIERYPFICENGGAICWPDKTVSSVGQSRTEILDVLDRMRDEFSFRSFADMGPEGVADVTGLTIEKAKRATDRHATEPLLLNGDDPETVERFRSELQKHGLGLTKGGRFWHVAGQIDKGFAMKDVVQWFEKGSSRQPTIAVGDSPNDQRMLSLADFAVLIPGADGKPKFEFSHRELTVASISGAKGWGLAVGQLMDRLIYKPM